MRDLLESRAAQLRRNPRAALYEAPKRRIVVTQAREGRGPRAICVIAGIRWKDDTLARSSYSYEKRRKELEKRKKKEQKRLRKLEKKNPQPTDNPEAEKTGDQPEGL